MLSFVKKSRKMFFCLVKSGSPHEESNLRPLDSVLWCSTTEPQRLYGEQGTFQSPHFLFEVNFKSIKHVPVQDFLRTGNNPNQVVMQQLHLFCNDWTGFHHMWRLYHTLIQGISQQKLQLMNLIRYWHSQMRQAQFKVTHQQLGCA